MVWILIVAVAALAGFATYRLRVSRLRAEDEALHGRDRQRRELEVAAIRKLAEVEAEATLRKAEIDARLAAQQARLDAEERLRRVDAGINDPEHGRTAQRIMGIAVQRYRGHYLTERLLTNLPIAAGALERIGGDGEANLRIIEELSHVKLLPSETG